MDWMKSWFNKPTEAVQDVAQPVQAAAPDVFTGAGLRRKLKTRKEGKGRTITGGKRQRRKSRKTRRKH